MSPYERGLVRSPRKTDAILEKALGSHLGESRQSAILEIFRASSYSKNEKDFKLF